MALVLIDNVSGPVYVVKHVTQAPWEFSQRWPNLPTQSDPCALFRAEVSGLEVVCAYFDLTEIETK